jgi:hypothetical protein
MSKAKFRAWNKTREMMQNIGGMTFDRGTIIKAYGDAGELIWEGTNIR